MAAGVRSRPAPLAAVVALLACHGGRPPVPSAPHLSRAQLHDAGAIPLDALAQWTRPPTADVREEIELAIRDDLSGRGFEGRGVLAVRPRQALRMILLGPGGTTAMDVWIANDRWRVAIPALERVVRGDASTPPAQQRGLPIALLSRWLVDPFGGTVVAAHAGRVSPDAEVIDDRSLGPSGARSFVVFARRVGAFEVRAREVRGERLIARAWWLERGRIVAWLDGEETPLGAGDAAPIVPTSATYVTTEPPMTVRVRVGTAALTGALPAATFADPDGSY